MKAPPAGRLDTATLKVEGDVTSSHATAAAPPEEIATLTSFAAVRPTGNDSGDDQSAPGGRTATRTTGGPAELSTQPAIA